jgi:hypothetical protein
MFLLSFYFLNMAGARENPAKPEETRSAAGGLVPKGGHTLNLPSGLRGGRCRIEWNRIE